MVPQCYMLLGPCVYGSSNITGDNHVTCVQLSKPDVATLPSIALLVAKRKVSNRCFVQFSVFCVN